MSTINDGWNAYWFARGGRVTIAILRIAVAFAVLLTLCRVLGDGAEDIASRPREIYHPVLVWRLFPGPPGVLVIQILEVAAWLTTIAMLIGLQTRIMTPLSFVFALLVISLDVSFAPTWSHDFNLPLLAQIALFGGHAGDALGVDTMIRRRRGRPIPDHDGGYVRSIRLCQLFVAMMFLSAVTMKMVMAHGTLAWALSDNLRHHLLVHFDAIGVPRTAAADWLLGEPWRWHAAAAANLASQVMPIVAVVAIRRPRLRLLCGAFFVIETLALGIVMDLWNWQWLPLAAAFVDWEHFLGTQRTASTSAPARRWPGRAARIALPILLAYEVFISFAPTVDQKLATYPFTSFPMFARVRARRPFTTHQPYTFFAGAFELDPDASAVSAELNRHKTFREMHTVRDPAVLRTQLAAALAFARARAPSVERVGLRLVALEAPAVPAPAQLVRHPVALVGELDVNGRMRTLLGTMSYGSDGADVELPPELASSELRLVTFTEQDPTWQPLEARRDGARRSFALPPAGRQIAAVVGIGAAEQAFLISARSE